MSTAFLYVCNEFESVEKYDDLVFKDCSNYFWCIN